MANASEVVVDDSVLKEILNEAGFPIVDYADVALSKDDAVDLFLWPAMRAYFSYFPRIIKTSHQVSGIVNVPFPDALVYGVAHARIALSSSVNAGASFNPLHNNDRYRETSRSKNWRDPYYTRDLRLAEETADMSYVSLRKAGNFEEDRAERVLTGFSNIAGELVIAWAAFSKNFAAVRFEHHEMVIHLARAYVLRYFGMLRKQQDPNTGIALDGDTFISRADTLEEKITEKMKNRTKVVVLK
jgi:hypothetical protein